MSILILYYEYFDIFTYFISYERVEIYGVFLSLVVHLNCHIDHK